MSQQSPPVTVITIPSEAVSTTTTPTTTTSTPATTVPEESVDQVTETTTPATTATTVDAVANPSGGGTIFLLLLVVLVVLGVIWWVWRRRSPSPGPAVVLPAGGSLSDRVRRAVEEAETAEPGEYHGIEDLSVADLYPWIEPPEDLTLVVDLRTAEALQGVGITSLDQLANLDDDLVRSMIDAGIDLDTRAVEAAAQDILGRRSEGGTA